MWRQKGGRIRTKKRSRSSVKRMAYQCAWQIHGSLLVHRAIFFDVIDTRHQAPMIVNVPISVWEVRFRIFQSRHFFLHKDTFDLRRQVRRVSTRMGFGRRIREKIIISLRLTKERGRREVGCIRTCRGMPSSSQALAARAVKPMDVEFA